METVKIIKIGGNIINDEKTLSAFLVHFSQIEGLKILVHGGGKSASQLAKKMNIPVTMIDGRRVTDKNTLDIITMIYAGKINKNIVAQLQALDSNAIGLTGADGNCIVSQKRPVSSIDYGFVGDIFKVNTQIPKTLLNLGIVPVFCAITHDKNGQLLNTNADTIASAIAIGLASHFKTTLYYCFEKPGVLLDVNNDDSIIKNLNTDMYQKLKKDKVIYEGMLPKLDNCFHALENNVQEVCIGGTQMLFEDNNLYTSLHL